MNNMKTNVTINNVARTQKMVENTNQEGYNELYLKSTLLATSRMQAYNLLTSF
jgi:hypothetical protein